MIEPTLNAEKPQGWVSVKNKIEPLSNAPQSQTASGNSSALADATNFSAVARTRYS